MSDTSGIYCLTINNKKYIGSSINVNRRIRYHLSLLKNNKHYNKHLQSAYNLHFNVETTILEKCHQSELMTKEKYYIDFYNVLDNKNGYNAAPNPFEGARGVKWSVESKNKLSKALKEQYASGNRKIGQIKHDEKVRERISKSLIGHKPARTCNILCHQNKKEYASLHAAAKDLNMSPSSVCDVLKKRKNNCKGYTFEYIKET